MTKTNTFEIPVSYQPHDEQVPVNRDGSLPQWEREFFEGLDEPEVTPAASDQLGLLDVVAVDHEKEKLRKQHQRSAGRQDHGTKGAWPKLVKDRKPPAVVREGDIDKQASRDAMDAALAGLTPEELEHAATEMLVQDLSRRGDSEYHSDDYDKEAGILEASEGSSIVDDEGTAMEQYSNELTQHLRNAARANSKRDLYEALDADDDNPDFIDGIDFKRKKPL